MRTGRPRKVYVNETFFNADTAETHYWAGFILADGGVSWEPRWVLNVNLKITDADHLELLHEQVGGSARFDHCAHLAVHSKALVQSLSRFGVVPRKSTEPTEPLVVSTAFLRGAFDGDGCLHVDKRGRLSAHFCGAPLIVDWFVRRLGVPCPSIRDRQRTRYAQWGSHSTAIEICRRLYDGVGPSLHRKARIAGVFIHELDHTIH